MTQISKRCDIFDINGEEKNHNFKNNIGIIPRISYDLFNDEIYNPDKKDIKIAIQCSYLELYNDRVLDLLENIDDNKTTCLAAKPPKTPKPTAENKLENNLHPSTPISSKTADPNFSENLKIRQKSDGEIYIQGLTKRMVTCPEDVIRFLNKGNQFRKTGSTEMNKTSSRSHACFTIYFLGLTSEFFSFVFCSFSWIF